MEQQAVLCNPCCRTFLKTAFFDAVYRALLLGRVFFRGRTTKCRWPHTVSRRSLHLWPRPHVPSTWKTPAHARVGLEEPVRRSRQAPVCPHSTLQESIPSTSGHAYPPQHFVPLRGACGQTCFCVRFAVSAAVKQWSGRANQSK